MRKAKLYSAPCFLCYKEILSYLSRNEIVERRKKEEDGCRSGREREREREREGGGGGGTWGETQGAISVYTLH